MHVELIPAVGLPLGCPDGIEEGKHEGTPVWKICQNNIYGEIIKNNNLTEDSMVEPTGYSASMLAHLQYSQVRSVPPNLTRYGA